MDILPLEYGQLSDAGEFGCLISLRGQRTPFEAAATPFAQAIFTVYTKPLWRIDSQQHVPRDGNAYNDAIENEGRKSSHRPDIKPGTNEDRQSFASPVLARGTRREAVG